MSAVAIGSQAAYHDDEDEEDAPMMGASGQAKRTDKTGRSTAARPSSPWQALTWVMAFNLLLTLGALGSQAALLLKVSPVVSAVMDLQARMTGLQASAQTLSQSQTSSSEQREKERSDQKQAKQAEAEIFDLILNKLDSVKTQMVSAAQIDTLKAQMAIAAQPAPVTHDGASAPGQDVNKDAAVAEKEKAQAPSPPVASADAEQAAAPVTSNVKPGVTNDDFSQVLVYNGQAQALGKKGELHSQFGQDWLVSSVLGCKRDGFFIDLAANDAVYLSNTLTLERDFGWKGACLEANSNYIYGLARRKCQTVIAAIGAPKNTKVTFALRGALGGIIGDGFSNSNKTSKRDKEGSIDMYLAEFSEILETVQAPAIIDYMSLDVEGAEKIVMETFPWTKYTIMIFNVERPKKDLKSIFVEHGYQKLRDSKNGDEFWVHNSFPNLDKVVQEWGTRGKLPESTCMDAQGYERPKPEAVR